MDCIYPYTASLHNGEKGNWGGKEGGCAVVLVLVLRCATNGRTAVPLLAPGELCGSLGELTAIWQQMSGFRLWHVMVLSCGSNSLV